MSFNMLRLVVISVHFVCIWASPSPERHRLLDRGIIGGSYAEPNQFPYQLSLQHNKNHICGAALVSRKIAITAAHCTKNKKTKYLSVVAGIIDIRTEGVRIRVGRSEEHHKYNPVLKSYDIAIVFLKKSFTLGAGINVITLPQVNEVIPVHACATVSGWGTYQPKGDYISEITNSLKYVQIPIWKDVKCLKLHQVFGDVYCGGIDSGLENACAGDSGGPLVYRNKLFGVVTYGFGCGTPNKPAVYTNVAAYRTWITKTAKL